MEAMDILVMQRHKPLGYSVVLLFIKKPALCYLSNVNFGTCTFNLLFNTTFTFEFVNVNDFLPIHWNMEYQYIYAISCFISVNKGVNLTCHCQVGVDTSLISLICQ